MCSLLVQNARYSFMRVLEKLRVLVPELVVQVPILLQVLRVPGTTQVPENNFIATIPGTHTCTTGSTITNKGTIPRFDMPGHRTLYDRIK
jgi:hypothetical protein